jgi:hypothetical protein
LGFRFVERERYIDDRLRRLRPRAFNETRVFDLRLVLTGDRFQVFAGTQGNQSLPALFSRPFTRLARRQDLPDVPAHVMQRLRLCRFMFCNT